MHIINSFYIVEVQFEALLSYLSMSRSSGLSTLPRPVPIDNNRLAISYTMLVQFSSVMSSPCDFFSWIVAVYHSGKNLFGRSSILYMIDPL